MDAKVVTTTLLNLTCHLFLQQRPEEYTLIPGTDVLKQPDFCVTSQDCSTDKICAQFRCVDPCLERCKDSNQCTTSGLCVCGPHTTCHVNNHIPVCACKTGYVGDPTVGCTAVECQENKDCTKENICSNNKCTNPCLDVCGPNSVCTVSNHLPSCVCKTNYTGNPVTGCVAVPVPDCTADNQCPENNACSEGKCKDPCPGVCGDNATCEVFHHIPSCVCKQGFTGNPFSGCNKIEKTFQIIYDKKINWYDALGECAKQGLRLATVNNAEEFDVLREKIMQTVKTEKLPYTSFWLSGSDQVKKGSYVWMSTGNPVTYFNWAQNEPSHAVYNGEVEYCLEIWGRGNYYMNDYRCSEIQHFVCENFNV